MLGLSSGRKLWHQPFELFDKRIRMTFVSAGKPVISDFLSTSDLVNSGSWNKDVSFKKA